MTDRTFTPGGFNSVYDATNWTPTGVPQAGDTLTMNSGTAYMVGGNLFGDTLVLEDAADQSSGSATVDLSGRGNLIAQESSPPVLGEFFFSAIFNVTQHSTLTLTAQPPQFGETTSTINLSGGSTLDYAVSEGPFSGLTSTINDVGSNTLQLAAGSTVAVNLVGANSILHTTLSNLAGAAFDVDGPGKLDLSGAATPYMSTLDINSDVIGTADLTMNFCPDGWQFNARVGAGITVDLGSGSDNENRLTLGDSHGFKGTVDYHSDGDGSIHLTDLIDAASYNYNPAKDLLSFYRADGSLTERLHFDAIGGEFTVANQGAAGILIAPSLNGGIALPLLGSHSA